MSIETCKHCQIQIDTDLLSIEEHYDDCIDLEEEWLEG